MKSIQIGLRNQDTINRKSRINSRKFCHFSGIDIPLVAATQIQTNELYQELQFLQNTANNELPRCIPGGLIVQF